MKIKLYTGFFTRALMISGLFTGFAMPGLSGQLEQDFKNPPAEFRLIPIAHGSHTAGPALMEWLESRRAGGTVVDASQPRGEGGKTEKWVSPGYLNTPAAFDRIRRIMTDLKAEGVQVWLYDELGYPSGSAGGRVLEGHPEFAVQALRCRRLNTDGHPLPISFQGTELAGCLAFPLAGGRIDITEAVDLTQKARTGSFTWQPPAGDWTVCLYERFFPDTWKRHNINRRNVNIMDRRVVRRFIELTHEKYAQELGPQLKDAFLFFTDEPQLGACEPWMHMARTNVPPAVQWCDELPVAFEQKKGYPVSEALPALFNDAGPETGRYRYDFYDVYSDLIAENYFAQIEQWCHAHGIRSSGHMLLEESLLFHPMFSGSMLKNWQHQDLPGIDQLVLPRYKTMDGWNGRALQVDEDFSVKMAASICALTGKQGVFSESYALADRATKDPTVMLRRAKGIAAWQFACGVTHMCTYTLQQKLTAGQYAELSDFVGRLALLCRRGRPVSDVAVLVPEASVWACYNPPDGGTFANYLKCNPEVMEIDTAFRQVCHRLLASQRDFEIVSEELLNKAEVKGGQLAIADQKFSFLILPETRMLSERSFQKIERFAASGGYVIFAGTLPFMSASKGFNEKMREQAEALLRSNPARVRLTKNSGDFPESLNWMAKQVPPVITWTGSEAVRLAHQRGQGYEIILIANPGGNPAQGTLKGVFKGKISVWNPENGEIAGMNRQADEEPVHVKVPPDSALFLVVEN